MNVYPGRYGFPDPEELVSASTTFRCVEPPRDVATKDSFDKIIELYKRAIPSHRDEVAYETRNRRNRGNKL